MSNIDDIKNFIIKKDDIPEEYAITILNALDDYSDDIQDTLTPNRDIIKAIRKMDNNLRLSLSRINESVNKKDTIKAHVTFDSFVNKFFRRG